MISTNLLSTSATLRGIRIFAGMLGILAATLIGANAGLAAAGGLVDNGGFFSEQARSDAAKVIAETERTMHKDIAIETFKEIPAALKPGVNLQDKAALGAFFQQWALKQAREKHVNGVYILIVREPAHLQIEVGSDTQRQAFTLQDRETLSATMRTRLHAHQNDAALRDGVNFILGTMRAHLPNRTYPGTVAAPSMSHPVQSAERSSGWLLRAVLIGVVVWLVIGLFRALSGRVGGGPAVGQPGGGGGFLSSLVGGMFGAAAGMWMYDQFFSNHGNSAFGSDRNDLSGNDGGYTGQDTDYSGSGGDFGDDSGGGSGSGGDDFGGGGDFGGGDSGGGDF